MDNDMNIVDFNKTHIADAVQMALANYEEERRHVSILPEVSAAFDLSYFAENGLGVAAFESNCMLGFLCAYEPLLDVFGTTNVSGTFSPIHAHGVITADYLNKGKYSKAYNRDRIYSLLYQAAADKWVKEGIRSHAIALYTHDKEAVNSFFYNGFGLRCIDAIRSLENIPEFVDYSPLIKSTLEYSEVQKNEWGQLLDLHNQLLVHLGKSPTFMRFDLIDEIMLYNKTSNDVRYFSVKAEGSYIAYVKIAEEGENFITEDSSMMNICGAYCDDNYRGTGVFHNLLCYLMTTLKSEGYCLLGVDMESINPNARGFWLKYFTEYTHSVVRRIDEKAISNI